MTQSFEGQTSVIYRSLSGDTPNRHFYQDTAQVLQAAIDGGQLPESLSVDKAEYMVDSLQQGRYMFWVSAFSPVVINDRIHPALLWAYQALQHHVLHGPLPCDAAAIEQRRHVIYAMSQFGQKLADFEPEVKGAGVVGRSAPALFRGEPTQTIPFHLTNEVLDFQALADLYRMLARDIPDAPASQTARLAFDPGRLTIELEQASETQGNLTVHYEDELALEAGFDANMTRVSDGTYLPELLAPLAVIQNTRLAHLQERSDFKAQFQQLMTEVCALAAARKHVTASASGHDDRVTEYAAAKVHQCVQEHDLQSRWGEFTFHGRHPVIGDVEKVFDGPGASEALAAFREQAFEQRYKTMKVEHSFESRPLDMVSDVFLETTPDTFLTSLAMREDCQAQSDEHQADPLSQPAKAVHPLLFDFNDL